MDTTTANGTIIVTWEDGTTSTYTLPDPTEYAFSAINGIMTFSAFPVNTEAGIVLPHTLNFAKMRGFVTINVG